jgi:hypothetical protein
MIYHVAAPVILEERFGASGKPRLLGGFPAFSPHKTQEKKNV